MVSKLPMGEELAINKARLARNVQNPCLTELHVCRSKVNDGPKSAKQWLLTKVILSLFCCCFLMMLMYS